MTEQFIKTIQLYGVDEEQITPHKTLQELGFDILDKASLACELENIYNIEILYWYQMEACLEDICNMCIGIKI